MKIVTAVFEEKNLFLCLGAQFLGLEYSYSSLMNQAVWLVPTEYNFEI